MKIPPKPNSPLAGGSFAGSMSEHMAHVAKPAVQAEIRQQKVEKQAAEDSRIVDLKAVSGHLVKVRADGKEVPVLKIPKPSSGGGGIGSQKAKGIVLDNADPAGTAATLIAAHEAAADPHSAYLTQAEADALYEDAGAVAAHEAASNPHPTYLTQAEGDALYEDTGAAAAAIAAHEGAADPHTQYLTEAEGDAAYDALGSAAARQAALSGASLTGVTVATDDKVLIQDTSDSDNLKTVTAQAIADLADSGGITLGTPVASTSGTAIDFTGIPDGVRRVSVMLSGVSSSGTSVILIRLGDSGGIEATGYVNNAGAIAGSAAAEDDETTGFEINNGSVVAASLYNGVIELIKFDASSNVWIAGGTINTASRVMITAGTKTLSATLDRVRITTVGGTDTFDAGEINIAYES